MDTVAGKLNAKTEIKPLDPDGLYESACDELATSLGWGTAEVFGVWREMTLMREYECRWPRRLAEWRAMRDVRACLHKPGQRGD